MKPFTPVLLTAVLLSPIFISAQQTQPAPPASPTTPAGSGPSNPPTSGINSKGQEKPLPTFLIVGTVFNEKSLSFPEVEVRIRRGDEKKFRWKTYTNSRGEFAVRVLPGYEYEVAVHVKGYKDQSKSVDGKVDVQRRLSIVLEPVNQPKDGAKP